MSDAPRISRVTTRTGDTGDTGLADGSRVPKHHPLIEALGDLDELNSWIGILRADGMHPDEDATAEMIQHRLFDLGGSLAGGKPASVLTAAEALDTAVKRLNDTLPPLQEFVLPGGSKRASRAHVARTVARRAERRVVEALTVGDAPDIPGVLPFLNRLSDWLFVLARRINRDVGKDEPVWRHDV